MVDYWEQGGKSHFRAARAPNQGCAGRRPAGGPLVMNESLLRRHFSRALGAGKRTVINGWRKCIIHKNIHLQCCLQLQWLKFNSDQMPITLSSQKCALFCVAHKLIGERIVEFLCGVLRHSIFFVKNSLWLTSLWASWWSPNDMRWGGPWGYWPWSLGQRRPSA